MKLFYSFYRDEDEFSNLKLYEKDNLLASSSQTRQQQQYNHHHYEDDDDDNDDCCCNCSCCKCCLCFVPKNTWCVKDVCGIVCAIMTWSLIVFAEIVVTFVILIPSPSYLYSITNAIIFNILAFLAVSSHLAAMFTDPVTNLKPFFFPLNLKIKIRKCFN